MSKLRQISEVERVSMLQLARTESIGAMTFAKLLLRYGSAGVALAALPDLARAGGRNHIRLTSRMAAEAEIELAAQHKAKFVAAGEAGYPPWLAQVDGAPPLLCVAGDLNIAAKDLVAIVGARNASAIGLKFTRMIARALADSGVAVASGLARGIDTAAHEASLHMATAAAVAGGIDIFYPPENERLQRDIAERGLLISEMSPGVAPREKHFPRRNRIISGMSRAVIVVEAALRSGSLITARFAGEQGRDVFAVPGSPLDPRCEGSNRLIKDGATIVTSVDDLLETLRMSRPPDNGALFEPTPLAPMEDLSTDDRNRLVTFLSPTETPLDDLVRESKMPPEIVAAILLELEIAGRVARGAGGTACLLVS